MNKIFDLACLGEFLLLPFAMDFMGHAFLSGEAVKGSPEIAVTGYIAPENLRVLCNPAVATPGLQPMTAGDLKRYWRSDHYSALSNEVLSRPAIIIDKP